MASTGQYVNHLHLTPESRHIAMPASHHSIFYRPDALPEVQSSVSKDWSQWSAINKWDKTHSRLNQEVELNVKPLSHGGDMTTLTLSAWPCLLVFVTTDKPRDRWDKNSSMTSNKAKQNTCVRCELCRLWPDRCGARTCRIHTTVHRASDPSARRRKTCKQSQKQPKWSTVAQDHDY